MKFNSVTGSVSSFSLDSVAFRFVNCSWFCKIQIEIGKNVKDIPTKRGQPGHGSPFCPGKIHGKSNLLDYRRHLAQYLKLPISIAVSDVSNRSVILSL